MNKKLILSLILSIFIANSAIQAHPAKNFAQAIITGAGLMTGGLGTITAIQNYPKFKKTYIDPAPPEAHKQAFNQIQSIWDQIPQEAKQFTSGMIGAIASIVIVVKVQQYLLGKFDQFELHKAGSIKENFNTVAGNTEAKEEVKDLVDYLKNPKKFQELGARIPKGVLLTGSPGTGKTLLARALAGEANCSFISCSGSDFVEMYVGVGAGRVRSLFNTARKNGPCIIFIDEIDALAKKRTNSTDGGSSEYNQTINQLLTEMDGFSKSDKPVIIIGATNHASNLDPAVLRPGRFDRTVKISLPDVTSREAILQVHLLKIKHDPHLDIHKIAQTTPGLSGADLANLVNEAAIIATKKGLKMVTIHEFESAKDKVTLGIQNKTIKMTASEKKYTAYHEAGHALVTLLSPQQNNALNKVTILPQGPALGVTHSMPEKEVHSYNKNQLLAQINIALGGRAAEDLMFNEIATGASSDFEGASNIARAMICQYGMTDILGKQVIISNQPYSQETLKKIDEGVTKILETQYKEVMNMLRTHKDKLEKLAQTLLQKETLYADEIYTLLNIPPRKTFKIA